MADENKPNLRLVVNKTNDSDESKRDDADDQPKIPVMIFFTQSSIDRLEILRKLDGMPSLEESARNAFRYYDWYLTQRQTPGFCLLTASKIKRPDGDGYDYHDVREITFIPAS